MRIDEIMTTRRMSPYGHQRSTVWYNVRTDEWIDIAEDRAIHHNEHVFDNASQYGIDDDHPALARHDGSDLDALASDPDIRAAAFESGWVRIIASTSGWQTIHAATEQDLWRAAQAVSDRYPVTRLHYDIGPRDSMEAKKLEEPAVSRFLKSGRLP